MIVGIQLIGILFGVVMIYFSYLYYRRGNYGKQSLALWLITWLVVVVIFAVPQLIYAVMEVLAIQRTADFFTAAAIIFLTTITFYTYTNVKKQEKKMEDLVRKVALERVEKTKKKKK